MRMGFLLRLQITLLILTMAPALAFLTPANAAAQTGNGFIMDATRTCSNELVIRWDQRNVESIEFTVSNTSDNWASDWIVIPDLSTFRHYEAVGRSFDKVMVRATFIDGNQQVESADTGWCADTSNSLPPTLDDGNFGGGGHGGPTPSDGTYYDPATGNSFSYVSAEHMCADNSLVVTWSGVNVDDLMFTAYDRKGWETGWLQADPASDVFTTAINRDAGYFVDAAAYFKDGDIQTITVNLTECTTADSEVVPDAGIGKNNLVVRIIMPDGSDITGSAWHLFADQAVVLPMPGAYLSGQVGANNTIRINGLIPDSYRIMVFPGDLEPFWVPITVADRPVTEATVTVAADGKVTVEYAAQVVQKPSPEEAANSGDASSGQKSSEVTGLPETGVGSNANISIASVIAIATAASVLALGSMMIRRKSI